MLKCSETDLFYIGSSINPKKRLSQHKNQFNSCMSRKLKKPVLSIIEKVEDESDETFKKKLLLREKHYITEELKNDNCVNKLVPLRTPSEYIKFKLSENPNYHKETYIKYGGIKRNLRTRKECECGGIYIQRNLKFHKQTAIHKKHILKNNITTD